MRRGSRRSPAYRLPEKLVEDTTLSPYAKQLALLLFGLAEQRTGEIRVSQRRLAALSRMALATVSRRLRELEDAGYLVVKKQRAHYDRSGKRFVRKTDVYICIIPQNDYLLVPCRLWRRIFRAGVHGAQVSVFLYIYRLMRLEELRRRSAKRERRAYPSFSMLTANTGHADSTVRAALKALTEIGLLHTQRCRKRCGAYTCNSYFLLHISIRTACEVSGTGSFSPDVLRGTPEFETIE